MKTLFAAIALVALVALAAGCALFGGDQAPAKFAGGVLVARANDMTLYTFDRDPPGRSVCTGPCAANWPPLAAPADAKPIGDFTILTRDDGTRQWAYRGKPLYFWTKDAKPGDRTGEGFNNLWRVVKG